jgi:hypothetical protein
MIDCCDGDLTDCDLYAHMAGDGASVDNAHDVSPTSSADTAPSGQDASDTDATDVDLGISALVAEGLGNLLLN